MQSPIVLVLIASSQPPSDTRRVAGKAAAAATVLHTQGTRVVFSGWYSPAPSHWRNREIPFIELEGNLRSDLPFSHILVFGDESAALKNALAEYQRRFQTQVLRHCEALELNEVLQQIQQIPTLTCNLESSKLTNLEATADISGQRDVVVFWKQNDTGLYGRRSDMLIRYLLSRDDVRRVLVFDAPVKVEELLARAGVDWFDQTRHIYVQTLQRILDTAPELPFAVAPDKLRVRTGVFDKRFGGIKHYQQFVTEALAEFSINPSQALFVMYPRVRGGEALLAELKPWRVVTDVVDDHRAWPNVSEQRHAMLTAHYRDILGASWKVMTNCVPVKVSMLAFHDQIQVIPNGCDVSPPQRESMLNATILSELRTFAGKVLVYTGNLESKIDVPLLAQVATAYPDALLVLIGSTHANAEVLELQRFPNVRFTGVLPYADANAVLQFADVGLVPHLTTALTENMNPLKVFVYLAHCIPVVTTAVANIVVHDCVRHSVSHDAFVVAIAELFENKPPNDLFERFVQDNSWERRFHAWFFHVLHG